MKLRCWLFGHRWDPYVQHLVLTPLPKPEEYYGKFDGVNTVCTRCGEFK